MAASGNRLLSAALLALALGACTGAPPESVAPVSMPAGQAHLILKRTTIIEGYSTLARVELNGQSLGELSREAGVSKFIPAGKTVVAVASASAPGRYAISFDAQPGKSYYLEVTTRPEGYVPPTAQPLFPYELIENEGGFKILPAQ